MTKPAGQDGARTPVRPEPGEAAFSLAPWLKGLPDVPLHPLMVHPVAAMAATTAIGFGVASQFAGLMVGAMQGATARARAALDEAAEAPVKAKPALTVVEVEKRRPRAAKKPAAGKADDLKAISGIGPKLEQVLSGMGYGRYADIADWTAVDMDRIDAELGLDGRIARDGWVEQAKALATARG